MAPAKLMFARKICLVFDRLRPTEKKMVERKNTNGKHYNLDEKIYFKNYKFGKVEWEEGIPDKRIGKMYLIKNPKWVIKRHLNQIKKKIYGGHRSTHRGTDDGDLRYVRCIYASTSTIELIK